MMDREQIIHFAMVSGLYDTLQDGMPGAAQWIGVEEELEAFAKLVADAEAKRMQDEGMVTIGHMREQVAKEREVCAKMVDAANPFGRIAETAAAIRARGQ
jgi:hypothetical protein